MSTPAPATVILFDGHSLAFRAFYALAEADLRTSAGHPTHAVFGFTSMLIKAWHQSGARHLAVAFDRGKPLERLRIRPEYKAQRITPPDEFTQQLGLIREVLATLRIPVFELDNVEADDVINVVGARLVEEGHQVLVVTADRDFFQMVGPKIQVMINRRGVTDTVIYDTATLRQRFGFEPERYLDYMALRGDPSDNIPGVPGVGEKTAAGLVQTYGTLEAIFAHLEKVPLRIRGALEEARRRLLENREFFRFRSAGELAAQGVPVQDLAVSIHELEIGGWDAEALRRLFDTLEFRTLYERIEARMPAPAPAAALEAAVEEVSDPLALEALARRLDGARTVTVRVAGDRLRCREAPSALGIATPGGAGVVRLGGDGHETVRRLLGPVLGGAHLSTHGSKEVLLRMRALGIEPQGVAMDTEIAAYLVDPARGAYPLDELVRRYLKRDLALHPGPAPEGQQSLDVIAAPDDEVLMLGTEVVALEQLAPLLEKELVERGAWNLLRDLELPLAAVLARMEWAGVKVDVGYLEAMSMTITSELRRIEEEIFGHAGAPFNINSPPQLRTVLYERLGLRPSKRTKTGFSTDASVLESLREEHPIVDAILRFRERAKLKSTYIDALPPLVDPRTRRLHCRFNQTVAATGRLSSDSPNLQNIPVRTEEGRQIRRAFIPEDGYLLLVADYSQIELRVLAHLSRDPELVSAFERGQDIHRSSIARALGIDEDSVTPELRSIGKMVSYGVTYGMGAYGLSQRLRIPMEAARTYIEGFFALYPGVRTYLDSVVGRAAEEGYTTTLLGRRRYLPELRAANPRIRSLGERMALNAPIQGSAADIMKLAMVRADAALGEGPARMVLTVHDELVLEVPAGEVQEVGAGIREAMEGAVELSVPLKVDLAWGPNWAAAKA